MRSALLMLVLTGPLFPAQLTPAGPQPQAQTLTDYTAKREAALAPVLHLILQRDYVGARTAIEPLLTAYPHDLRILFLTAEIARVDRNFDQALALYQQCLDLKATYPGVIHLGMVHTYADMKRWTDFNRERAVLRQLALNGDRSLSIDRGYTVEDYRDGKRHISVLEFPSTDLQATTRFRFLFIDDLPPAAPFTPSIDLESNPVDAASFALQFPREAAAHVRPFALASYPDARTRVFIKFYPAGEPPYEDVHRDILALAASFPRATSKREASDHRPAYKKPPTTKP